MESCSKLFFKNNAFSSENAAKLSNYPEFSSFEPKIDFGCIFLISSELSSGLELLINELERKLTYPKQN